MEPKIIFIGTPEFGVTILEGLIKANLKPVLVVTALDKAVGRKQILTPPPVKLSAESHHIPVFQPKTISDFKSRISSPKPDLIIVAAYGHILPQELLEIPKNGSLNVHPSLLPKYRGASPIQYAILNGEKETGVTIMLMDDKMDRGPILSQSKTVIGPNETGRQLHDRLARLGAELLIKTVPNWLREEIKLQPQDEEKATYTKILKKEDGRIDWKKSAQAIERQIRAFDPWPETFCVWEKTRKRIKIKIKKEKAIKTAEEKIAPQRIKILKAGVLKKLDKKYLIGKTLMSPQNEFCVQTGQGFLVIEKLQPEGKKTMSPEAFLRGREDFIGTILK